MVRNYDFDEINRTIRNNSFANFLEDRIKELSLKLDKPLQDNGFLEKINALRTNLNFISSQNLKEYYTRLLNNLEKDYTERVK